MRPSRLLRDAYEQQVAGAGRWRRGRHPHRDRPGPAPGEGRDHRRTRALRASGVDLPIIAQVTVETTGTMLLGTEIGAALTALAPLGIDMIGLNCATGSERR
jgi:5-methyltetrahydrofolate--homocysteine methyltransferase